MEAMICQGPCATLRREPERIVAGNDALSLYCALPVFDELRRRNLCQTFLRQFRQMAHTHAALRKPVFLASATTPMPISVTNTGSQRIWRSPCSRDYPCCMVSSNYSF